MADNPLTELGTTGLQRWGGYIGEEWLSDLRGARGVQIYQQMADDDPIVGAVLFAIKMLCRQVIWRVDPGGKEKPDQEAADFLESCLDDMSSSWHDTITEILSFLVFGWSYHEIVYKRRQGDNREPSKRSKYEDGRMGWRKLSIRAQSSLLEWDFDPEGGIQGMKQLPPPDYQTHYIPIERALLFRTEATKGSPEGRALDPGTPIPTPDGWRVMDDLRPGDKVFDEAGRIRYVIARADWKDRPAYCMKFNGGHEIIADANHEWLTQLVWERGQGAPPKVRSTTAIADSVKNSNGVSNHSIGWAAPLDYPEQLLPIHPYILGLWLGDGWSRAGMIATHANDIEELCHLIKDCGYQAELKHNGPADSLGRSIRVLGSRKWASDCLETQLRVLGLLENKHIPALYLRASVAQRLDLLRGLMDSDGTVDKYGRCEFSNTDLSLIEGIAELVRSLGVGASICLHHKANGLTHKLDVWGVHFTPGFQPFNLSRKAARILNEHPRQKHYITEVEQVEPRRTVCIETDALSHLYLAGRNMVPTHNSILRNAYRPWRYKKNIEVIEGIGIERDLAGLPVAWVPPNIITDSDQAATLTAFKTLVTNIRRDEQEGIVMPLAYDEGNNQLYDLTLLTTGGRRQFETGDIIQRYDSRIAQSVLADFILLGSQKVGSFALATSKTGIFTLAIAAFLDEIEEVFNTHAVPRLFKLNGMSVKTLPQIKHGEIEDVDLVALGDFISKIADAGAPLFPNENLEKHLMTLANLPVEEGA